MSAHIIPFAYNDNLVRTVIIDGEPWFVAVDVCHVLGLSNVTRSLDRLDADEKGLHTVKTPGGMQDTNIVSEPGVYRLVFTSRKAEAEQFKRWLAHEVLPQLRRSGRYQPEAESPADERDARIEGEAVQVNTMRLSMVREARLLFGHERARALWSLIGLPAVPKPQPLGEDEPFVALEALWSIPLDPQTTLREALRIESAGGAPHAALAETARIICWRGREFVALAVGSPLVSAGMASGNFPDNWARTLRRLPGADHAVVKFSGTARRAVMVPAQMLDEDNTAWAAA